MPEPLQVAAAALSPNVNAATWDTLAQLAHWDQQGWCPGCQRLEQGVVLTGIDVHKSPCTPQQRVTRFKTSLPTVLTCCRLPRLGPWLLQAPRRVPGRHRVGC